MGTFESGVDEIVLFTSNQPANEPMLNSHRLNILTSNKILDRQRGAASASDAAADNNPWIVKGNK